MMTRGVIIAAAFMFALTVGILTAETSNDRASNPTIRTLAPADKLESVRAILAKRIIAAAMDGERDLGRLCDGALLALAQSNP
jgi:hypothetical protein